MIATTLSHPRANRLQVIALAAAAVVFSPAAGFASPVLSSDVAGFSVLGASAVTSTGATTLGGDLGVSNNSSLTGITGFFGTLANDGPGTATGTAYQGDAFALLAGNELGSAMDTLALLGPGTVLSLADLGGLTLNPGVYTVPAGTSNLTGTVTLDGLGDINARWVFQMPSTLITSAGSLVNVINIGSGAGAALFWNVGSSATLDTTTTFAGNILASASITMNNGVTLGCGRALARTGAVTMIDDTLSTGCEGTGYESSHGFNGSGEFAVATDPVPEPGSLALLGSGLFGGLAWLRRRARGEVV
ncbi:MAG: ice-binding family protein [Vicinamibacterales bacterium]